MLIIWQKIFKTQRNKIKGLFIHSEMLDLKFKRKNYTKEVNATEFNSVHDNSVWW